MGKAYSIQECNRLNSESMKKIILVLILACILGCERQDHQEKFFDFRQIYALDLASIDSFWKDDTNIDTSYRMPAAFEYDSGFIDGIRLFAHDREIWVSVFQSQDIAIDAMQKLDETSTIVIEEGDSDVIDGIWWFSDSKPYNVVFVSKWNTIINVEIRYSKFETVADTLYNTANEISRKVDHFSD